MLVLDAGGGPSRLLRIILELKADENFERGEGHRPPALPLPTPRSPHSFTQPCHAQLAGQVAILLFKSG